MPDGPRCLHAWLEEAAQWGPERPAVVDDGTLTIGRLCEQARSLAGALVRLGVRPGARVGLLMDKSAEAVTAVFGTLMAGGVYVPVPPSWPAHRIEATFAGCEATVVISASRTIGEAPAVTCRDTGESLEWRAATTGPPLRDGLPVDPGTSALMLFTSGSTGVPKGVTISHSAVTVFVRWAAETFGIVPSDRLVCPSPLNFDLSTLDVLSIAVRGAACVVMPEALSWMPRLATRFARDAAVTVWYSVPSMLMQMLDEGSFENEPIPPLRVILFAGEVMPPAYAARLRKAYPAAQIWNLYGPTETNVVTAHRLGDSVDPSVPLPIGRACAYATLRLDPDTVETKAGLRVGELLVGGASLMTGYWGRTAETERSFLRTSDPGADRYYRTGDRVGEGADGTLFFLGRLDRQIKRRGVRIELGEIEAALAAAPGVAEAATVAVKEGSSTAIAAFVAPRDGGPLDPGALRLHCARLLPSYMMPDKIQQLPKLPRGARGKIDYEALCQLCRRSA